MATEKDVKGCELLHDWRLVTDRHCWLWRCARCGAVYPYRVQMLPPQPADAHRARIGKEKRRDRS